MTAQVLSSYTSVVLAQSWDSCCGIDSCKAFKFDVSMLCTVNSLVSVFGSNQTRFGLIIYNAPREDFNIDEQCCNTVLGVSP